MFERDKTELRELGIPLEVGRNSAFGPLLAAVQAAQVVVFDYRRPVSNELCTRTVEPWGVVSWRGRWYLVGHDRDRDAPRCFRVSRIVGGVRNAGRPGAFRRPEGV